MKKNARIIITYQFHSPKKKRNNRN